jgi:cytochrome c biogenesis protein CcmG, thiol:disulfide interchange protein DsbE
MTKRYLALLFILLVTVTMAQNQKKIPNSKLEDLNGKKVQLKSYLGKGPVLIGFWATWCKPCQEELGEYQKIYDELKGKGFTFLAVSIDDEKSIGKVKPLVKAKNFSFPVLLDSNSDAARDLYVQDVPHIFLVDVKGNIVYSHRGYKKGDELELKKKIAALLK